MQYLSSDIVIITAIQNFSVYISTYKIVVAQMLQSTQPFYSLHLLCTVLLEDFVAIVFHSVCPTTLV